MTTRLVFALSLVAGVSVAGLAAESKTVTVWIPGDIRVDAATARIATIAKGHGMAEFSKACAKAPGKFDTYSAMIFDPGMGTTLVAEIATEKLPDKELGVDLSSLRAKGECSEGGRTWLRFSAVVSEPKAKEP